MCLICMSSIKIININAQNSEDKILCNATIDEDFDDSCVSVILNPYISKVNIIDDLVFEKLSQYDNVLSVENKLDFPERIVKEDGTLNYDVNSDLVDHLSKIEYSQVLKITLKEKSKQNVLELIKEIELFDEVFAAEPNYYSTPADVPSDTRISEQWNLISTNGINMPDVWDFVTGSEDVIVGVIDTGIASHDDLNDNIIAGKDFYNNTITTDDERNHGTCVAGIIGAKGNNYNGVSGINQKISIVPLQVSYEEEEEIKIKPDAVIDAIEYAIVGKQQM